MKLEAKLNDMLISFDALNKLIEYSRKADNKKYLSITNAQMDLGSQTQNPQFYINLVFNYESQSKDGLDRLADLVGIIKGEALEYNKEKDMLDRHYNELNLSTRARRAFERNGITTLREITNLTEGDLMKIKNFGLASLFEIKRELAKIGLSLKAKE